MTSLLALLLAVGDAHAQVPLPPPDSSSKPARRTGTTRRPAGAFGLGVAVGAPAGLTGKIWVGDNQGVQFNVGSDLGALGDLTATFDYTAHFRPFETDDTLYRVPLHIGVGANLSGNAVAPGGPVLFGIRVPAGATVQVTELPVDLFVEAAPTLYLFELFTWSVDGQIGVRYYF